MDLLWTDCLEDGCLFVNKQTKKQLKNLYCIISDELVSLTQRICSSDEVMFFFGGGGFKCAALTNKIHFKGVVRLSHSFTSTSSSGS